MKLGTVNTPQTFIASWPVPWKSEQKWRHFSYDRKPSYICPYTVKVYDILKVTYVWVRYKYCGRKGLVCSVADWTKCLDICWHNLYFQKKKKKTVLTFEDSSFLNTLIKWVSEWGFINWEGLSNKGSWVTPKPYRDVLKKQLKQTVRYPNHIEAQIRQDSSQAALTSTLEFQTSNFSFRALSTTSSSHYLLTP